MADHAKVHIPNAWCPGDDTCPGALHLDELEAAGVTGPCDCPCHEVIQPGLVPCPECDHSSR